MDGAEHGLYRIDLRITLHEVHQRWRSITEGHAYGIHAVPGLREASGKLLYHLSGREDEETRQPCHLPTGYDKRIELADEGG